VLDEEGEPMFGTVLLLALKSVPILNLRLLIKLNVMIFVSFMDHKVRRLEPWMLSVLHHQVYQ
jgi:hypothetical protein